ncbi:esterase protein [Rutstroemia sp. NJR-2017a BBW]|nr:esterase protein [Rutstroemia sp. NJR-2017a BBW]
MDPEFHAARTKYQAPKPLPSGPPSEFSKRLANNVFAQALATPVRQCAVNYTSLPSFFLQDFELMAHPTTGAPYHMPRSLTPKTKNQSSERSLPLQTPTVGSRYFVALRQALFQSFHKRKSGHHKAYERFGRGGQMTKERLANLENAIWRADMDTFILSRMRENIGSALLYVARLKKGYIVPCTDWQDAASKEQSGAVLWLGKNLQAEGGEAAAEVEEEQEVPPGEFDILHVKGNAMDGKKIVPVFNLRGMLDKEWVERLRDRNLPFDAFGAKIVVIKKKNTTKDILLDLWRLQGYVATYGEEMIQERKPDMIVMPKITADTKFRSILEERDE